MRNCIIRSLKTLQAVHKDGKNQKFMLACISGSFYVLHIDIYRTTIYTKTKKKPKFFYTQLSKADI